MINHNNNNNNNNKNTRSNSLLLSLPDFNNKGVVTSVCDHVIMSVTATDMLLLLLLLLLLLCRCCYDVAAE